MATGAIQNPVTSVNGMTGAVSINNYSSNEINTGKTWIDGKNIYRKVVEVTTTINAGPYEVQTGIPVGSISQMINMRGCGLNGQNYFPLHYPFSTSNLGYFYLQGATNKLMGNMPFTSSRTVFILEYTKNN